jgi:mono/diheme cytochrome c family protein
MPRMSHLLAALLPGVALCFPSIGRAEEPTAVERGQKALLGRHFNPPTISIAAYQNAWRQWGEGLKEQPANYDEVFRKHYGLPKAPYPNNGLPMGLREAPTLLGRKAISTDCLLCHGGAVAGESRVGLPNNALDIHALFLDLAKADGAANNLPFSFSNVRGTTEAGGFAVFLLDLRNPDLSLRAPENKFGLRDDLCEDAPAWWLLKKKKTMYYTGGGDARSVRSLMQFMMSPFNPPSVFEKEEATFVDIREYLLSLEPPKYPFPIDRELAHQGEAVFNNTCARCHGTYGEHPTYPNKIVAIDKIGTDRTRFDGLTEAFGEYYNKSWFAKEKRGWLADGYTAIVHDGYQAPPLDGVWATAPYFHNGSVPTVADVLNSKTRPKIFTRSFGTEREDYDPVKLGLKIQVLDHPADPKASDFEKRKVYNTTLSGRGNRGHTYGDDLTDDERKAVIEYLKTL